MEHTALYSHRPTGNIGSMKRSVLEVDRVYLGTVSAEHAAFIVRACNSHAELVHTLQWLCQEMQRTKENTIKIEIPRTVSIMAREALAKATKEG